MRFNYCRLLPLLAGFLTALVSGSGIGQITSVPPAAYLPPPLTKAAAVQRLLTADAPKRAIVLPPSTAAERDSLKAANAAPPSLTKAGQVSSTPGKGRPLAIGYGRDVPAADRSINGADLEWQPLPDGGSAARIDISSDDAAAVRVALAMGETDPDVTFRFVGSAATATVFGPYPANRIAETSGKDGMFWSPILEGATATIEVYVPASVSPKTLQFRLARISHLVIAGAAMRNIDLKLNCSTFTGIGCADNCEVDVVCITPPTEALSNAAKSVAHIVFTHADGFDYICTGTLINDSQGSFTPYFLVASHCIDSQRTATTMNSYWFFDAVTCGSLASPHYVLLADGAMLLGRSDDWDWGLVRLNSMPPTGSFFAAWRADPLTQSLVAASVLHHPMGDLKKWSQGLTQGVRSFSNSASFIQMRYTRGSTEGGSSGSALLTFFAPGGYYEVRGALTGGDASCSDVVATDSYSRLDNALPLLRQYLTPGSGNPSGAVPAVEFRNDGLNLYFLTTNPDEINDLDTGVHSGWERTGLRFLAYPDLASAPPGANPVCRFYEKPGFKDAHFMSADPQECADTLQRFGGHWIYESPNAFYIQLPDKTTGACPAGTRPVWRYLNGDATNHRYTVEAARRDDMEGNPVWTAEGYGPGPYYPVMCSPLQ